MPFSEVIEALNRVRDDLHEMTGELGEVRHELEKNKGVIKRLRLLTLGLVLALTLGGAGIAVPVYQNHHNAYIQCLNANESRAFNKGLWDFILGHELGDLSASQAPDEIVMSQRILPLIHWANRPRDCDNLDKKYDVPKVPDPPGGHVVIKDGKAVLVPKE